jgi:hypothetical protein
MTIRTEDVVRYLRMGGAGSDPALAGRILALRELAAAAIRPAHTWRRFRLSKDGIVSGGQTLQTAKTLSAHLEGCRDVYLVCGTLGTRFDALLRRVSATSGADALIVQAIGTAAIERLMDSVEDEISGELTDGETLTSRYSPGYGDFPLSAQRTILSLLDSSKKVGVSLTDTMLMVPSKSVSAVIGVRSAQ